MIGWGSAVTKVVMSLNTQWWKGQLSKGNKEEEGEEGASVSELRVCHGDGGLLTSLPHPLLLLQLQILALSDGMILFIY